MAERSCCIKRILSMPLIDFLKTSKLADTRARSETILVRYGLACVQSATISRLWRNPMRFNRFLILFAFLPLPLCANAQQAASLSPLVQKYVRVNTPRVVLEHVRVIDGTGRPPVEDQNVVIEQGKITAVLPGSDALAEGTTILDLRGYTVAPGIVGMHNHLFYIALPNLDADWNFDNPLAIPQMTFSAPRLYLANGVTTMRTTGSVETYTDLELKRAIEAGTLPGPHLDVTGPYLQGPNDIFIQMHTLTGPEDA